MTESPSPKPRSAAQMQEIIKNSGGIYSGAESYFATPASDDRPRAKALKMRVVSREQPNEATADAKAAIARALVPDLLINFGDLPAGVKAAAKLLAETGRVYNMGGFPVRVIAEPGEAVRIAPLSNHAVTMQVHELCRPITLNKKQEEVAITYPERAAKMLVDCAEGFSKLDGIASAPILSQTGEIRTAEGYDAATRLWCSNIPAVNVLATPSRADAEAALITLRIAFRTFPYNDSARVDVDGMSVVDISKPPGEAESAFLCGLFTAVCRASLWLAPGLLVTAPDVSGAGSGKGLLVQAICAISYGSPPAAFTAGSEKTELDKRIASELMQAGTALFLDNVNSTALKSDTLASVITERPARVRIFGQTKMATLNSTAFIAVTGNGLSVSEDLARRFIALELDAKCDDPEGRSFPEGRDGFLDGIKARRGELLAAVLTVWRWGRQNEAVLKKGKPLGGFETWARWIRDPLLTLGCADPVAQISRAKAHDPRRQRITELFEVWWKHHKSGAMKVADLHDDVKNLADPQGRSRQFLNAAIARMTGTRSGGYAMTRQEAAGEWGTATYALQNGNRPQEASRAVRCTRCGTEGQFAGGANLDGWLCAACHPGDGG